MQYIHNYSSEPRQQEKAGLISQLPLKQTSLSCIAKWSPYACETSLTRRDSIGKKLGKERVSRGCPNTLLCVSPNLLSSYVILTLHRLVLSLQNPLPSEPPIPRISISPSENVRLWTSWWTMQRRRVMRRRSSRSCRP